MKKRERHIRLLLYSFLQIHVQDKTLFHGKQAKQLSEYRRHKNRNHYQTLCISSEYLAWIRNFCKSEYIFRSRDNDECLGCFYFLKKTNQYFQCGFLKCFVILLCLNIYKLSWLYCSSCHMFFQDVKCDNFCKSEKWF